MKKNLSFILVLLSLLFNIQVGFTHDIEHPYHDNEHTEDLHHDSDHHDDVKNNNLIEEFECKTYCFKALNISDRKFAKIYDKDIQHDGFYYKSLLS